VPDDLAGGSLDRRDTAEIGEGGLALQPLGIVSDYGQSSVAACRRCLCLVGKPTSGRFPPPADRAARPELGDLFGEDLVAPGHRTKREPRVASSTSSGSSLRRKRAAMATSSFVESPRKRWRSPSGAVTRRHRSWLAACVLWTSPRSGGRSSRLGSSSRGRPRS
jgi:hypothetical protein